MARARILPAPADTVALAAMGCLLLGGGEASARQAGELYDALFPTHVEICAVSQIRPLDAPAGGGAGHAALYLGGVCPDPEAPFPQLRRCDEAGGVGVSVNKMFRNVNWVAVPGRRFFLHGILTGQERLTRPRAQETARRAVALGVFRGVQLHEHVVAGRPADLPMEEFAARESLGTDYALTYGRTAFCAKLPVEPAMMDRVVEFLNELNRSYATGEADYQWSGYHDNCTHTIRNALASAGVWRPKPVHVVKLLQIFHMAVPANEFVELASLTNDGPLDFGAIERNRIRRESLTRFGWLPTRHGSVIEVIPVHAENDVYDTGFHIFVLEGLLLRTRTWRARRMLADPRYTDLAANLRHFEVRYAELLRVRPRAPGRRANGSGLEDLGRRYREYLRQQLADVRSKLDQLP